MRLNKITHQDRSRFLETWILLLENGFDIHQSLQVMIRSRAINYTLLQIFIEGLEQGQTIPQCFAQSGFSNQNVLQISLVDIHGNLTKTIKNILEQILVLRKQKKALQKVLLYPVTLLIFVVILVLTLRQFLIPQLLDSGMVSNDHLSIKFIQNGPDYFFYAGLLTFVCSLILKFLFNKRSTIQQAQILTKIPLFGRLYQFYITSLFALEWGNLFKEGLEIRQIIECLSQIDHGSLITETALQMEQLLQKGATFSDSLQSYLFILPEFPLIVFYGSIKGKIGEELLVYHHLLLQNLVQTIEKLIRWIQPVMFIFIALFILSIYLALFLPIYGNLEGVLN